MYMVYSGTSTANFFLLLLVRMMSHFSLQSYLPVYTTLPKFGLQS